MKQNLFQQNSMSNGEGYQTLTPVTSTDFDYSLFAQDFDQQALFCDTSNLQAMYERMSQQICDRTGALETVQMFAPRSSVEHSRPSTQQEQTYLTRTCDLPLPPHDLVASAKRPLIPVNIKSISTLSNDEQDHDLASEPTTLPSNEGVERRKDRRRSQNRAAQRACRARKEEIIKVNTFRLAALQDELARLQNLNGGLSETLGNLSAKALRLRRENVALKRRSLYMAYWTNGSTEGDGDYIEPPVPLQDSRTDSDLDMGIARCGGRAPTPVPW